MTDSQTAAPKVRISVAGVRGRLSAVRVDRSVAITLDGQRIGGSVTYGTGRSVGGNVRAKTAYGSRIYKHGCSIEEEATSNERLLDKVAAVIAREMKAGKWPSEAAAAPEAETVAA